VNLVILFIIKEIDRTINWRDECANRNGKSGEAKE
jgi:hypothetical protein